MEPRLPRGLVMLPLAMTPVAARGGRADSLATYYSCSVPLPMYGEWRPRWGAFLGARGPQSTAQGMTRRSSAAPPPLHEWLFLPVPRLSVAEGV